MEQITENEWVQPQKKDFEFQINNGKKVLMDFRIHKGRVQFKVKDNPNAGRPAHNK